MNAETLKELLANATPGRRVQFHPNYCPEANGSKFTDWDTSHDTSVILPDGTRYRGYARHKHANDAALDALAPQLAAEVIKLREEVERLREALLPFAEDDGMCGVNSDYAAARASLNT